ncbi:hypothetical protein GVX82_00320 [Patescibacteria group bacterium]|jgi:hypothetical protein|nr:hypothetical protein [Patescibacteria group bacterium]
MPGARHTQVALATLGVLIIALTAYYLIPETPEPEPEPEPEPVVEEPTWPRVATIGSSVEGRPIEAYTFGEADTHLLLVGGIHGGYEWNSTLLAWEMIDHFSSEPRARPEGVAITIVPNLNPDGLFAGTGLEGRFSIGETPASRAETIPGRFNANGVDLNRNFACKWEPQSSWRGEVVSAGTEPFSEPEAAALRDLVASTTPDAVVFWHSKANNVYASECHDGPLPRTLAIMNAYADAADYGAVPVFDAYPITGDAEGWLASIGIPAITVELETHDSIEWERNLAGVEALLTEAGRW